MRATLTLTATLLAGLATMLVGFGAPLVAVEIAAGVGAVVAAWRLWVYLPSTQRRYERMHGDQR